MNRRIFFHSSLSLLLLPTLAKAENLLPSNPSVGNDNTLGGTLKPYMQIGNFTDDKHRVFMFISFDCHYCKSTWKGMGDWGKTLPEPFKFVFVPLSKGNKQLDLASHAFYVVRDLAPNHIENFLEIAFAKATVIRSFKEWITILGRLGLSEQAIIDSLNKPITEQRIERGRRLAGRYRLTATPHFGIAGKYATNADYINGDYRVLVKLLNVLVSESMQNG
ncbi:MAG: hypothetical protein IJ187_00395 [Neisseriaceae bacterium]|nr:hypothetical protein [Neisseriaceae bacterium]